MLAYSAYFINVFEVLLGFIRILNDQDVGSRDLTRLVSSVSRIQYIIFIGL